MSQDVSALCDDDDAQGALVALSDDRASYDPRPAAGTYIGWSTAPPSSTPDAVVRDWENFRYQAVSHQFDRDVLLEGVERSYSTSQAAAFFGKSNQWMYWGLRKGIFTYKDGTPIEPEWTGQRKTSEDGDVGPGRRRFTLPIIREIALSCHRRGNLSEEGLEMVMAKILIAEFGERAFSNTDLVS